MTISATKQYEIYFDNLDGDLSGYKNFILGFGFWCPSLFDVNYNTSPQSSPLSNIGRLVGDHMIRPPVLTLYGLRHYTDAFQATFYLQELKRRLLWAVDGLHMRVDVYSTSGTLQLKGLFGRASGLTCNPVQGSQYTVYQPQLRWAPYDPFLYTYASPETLTATMTTGNSVYCNISSGLQSYWRTQRWTSKIEVNIDGQVITNPKVESTVTGKWFQITGSISALGDYYLVDHLNGTVIEHDESAGTDTDIIDQFSGSFFDLEVTYDQMHITSAVSGDSDLKYTADVWEIWDGSY